MPNSNSSQQTKDDSLQPAVTFPSVSVEDTLPPTITTTTTTTSSAVPQDTLNPSPASSVPVDSGSAAPNNDLAMSGVVGTTPPKKKFAGGKVIATILGLFLLVGGVGAGVFLTSENQDIREKASSCPLACSNSGNCGPKCPTGQVCHCQDGDPCTVAACEPETGSGSTKEFCDQAGREWCVNQYGNAYTCCESGYSCCQTTNGCCGGSNPPNGTDEPPIGCLDLINIYDSNWTKVNDPSTLPAGTNVRVGIIDRYKTSVFSKARFTVNGTLRPETSAKREVFIVGTSGPKMTVFYDNITVSTGTTNIYAEVEFGGIWYGK